VGPYSPFLAHLDFVVCFDLRFGFGTGIRPELGVQFGLQVGWEASIEWRISVSVLVFALGLVQKKRLWWVGL